ncbi:hypothetical protein [Amorphus orientalis]|uniref:Lipoprotein n=1 Tax=Amorphus orientalis TaxID=649198 RepID=A0AAE4ASE3_9HYPH|nr:hypothetical protein [Amorphus orientalis]MDQ0316166.1 hypothetical protein [Amorphus orientalis]
MAKSSRSLSVAGRIAALAVAAGTLAACNTSHNYFYEEKPPQADQSVGLLGAMLESTGVVQREQTPIEYTARSPIAVPPTTELPEPQPEGGAALASADWPNDPDANKAKAIAANGGVYDDPLDGARLSPEQIQAGRVAGGMPGQKLEDPKYLKRDSGDRRLTPAEMKQGFESPDGKGSGRVLTADGSAQPRQYLIQPPDEYRQPADTAPLPDQGDIEDSDWFKNQLYGRKENRNPVYDNVN